MSFGFCFLTNWQIYAAMNLTVAFFSAPSICDLSMSAWEEFPVYRLLEASPMHSGQGFSLRTLRPASSRFLIAVSAFNRTIQAEHASRGL